MAVDSVTFDAAVPSSTGNGNETTGGSGTSSTSATRKVDPASEEDLLDLAVESFLPGMISNTLMLNNSLFNFVKEAIDEGDEG